MLGGAPAWRRIESAPRNATNRVVNFPLRPGKALVCMLCRFDSSAQTCVRRTSPGAGSNSAQRLCTGQRHMPNFAHLRASEASALPGVSGPARAAFACRIYPYTGYIRDPYDPYTGHTGLTRVYQTVLPSSSFSGTVNGTCALSCVQLFRQTAAENTMCAPHSFGRSEAPEIPIHPSTGPLSRSPLAPPQLFHPPAHTRAASLPDPALLHACSYLERGQASQHLLQQHQQLVVVAVHRHLSGVHVLGPGRCESSKA
eukprot:366008-Chlamydomonas_euryale.AAC.9